MDELEELRRLGNFIHAEFPVETKEIAFGIGSGNIVDVAIILLQDLKLEIARHHNDFEAAEEMADKGARLVAESKDLHTRTLELEREVAILRREKKDLEGFIRGKNAVQ